MFSWNRTGTSGAFCLNGDEVIHRTTDRRILRNLIRWVLALETPNMHGLHLRLPVAVGEKVAPMYTHRNYRAPILVILPQLFTLFQS